MGRRTPGRTCRDLYSLLCHPTWLRVAHRHVNANQGRETAGVDGAIMARFNGDVAGNLARSVSRSKPRPSNLLPVRRVYILKSQWEEAALRHPDH